MSERPSSSSLAGVVAQVLTILAVSDVSRAAAFYALFGWRRQVDVPVYVEFVMPNGQRLGLYQREAFAKNTGQLPAQVAAGALAATELYFYADDVPAMVARLHDAGARPLSPLQPRPWGDEAAYVADPDGNVIVIARPTVS